jgi:hypothetical protein
MFDAELNIWTGDVALDNERVSRLRKDGKTLLKNYNKKKAEYDKGPFRTPAEIYAEQHAPKSALQVVGGDPIIPETPQTITLVNTKPKRKYKGLFDVD